METELLLLKQHFEHLHSQSEKAHLSGAWSGEEAALASASSVTPSQRSQRKSSATGPQSQSSDEENKLGARAKERKHQMAKIYEEVGLFSNATVVNTNKCDFREWLLPKTFFWRVGFSLG